MPTTATNLVNRALVEIGSQTFITSLTDGSPNAITASQVFQPFYSFLLRQADWDFCRGVVGLAVVSGSPPQPWTFEYGYPADTARVRYLLPASLNVLDPAPIHFAVGTDLASEPSKVIWTDQAAASAVVSFDITATPLTDLEFADAMFQEALVRMLASAFSMANAGRPDYSKIMLEWASQFEQLGEGRPY